MPLNSSEAIETGLPNITEIAPLTLYWLDPPLKPSNVRLFCKIVLTVKNVPY